MTFSKRVFLLAILSLVGFSIFFTQCKHKPILKKIIPQPNDTVIVLPEDTTICFERDILPLFVTNCAKAGCHDAITQQEELVLTSFSVISPEATKLIANINSGFMNSTSGGSVYGNLTTKQVDLIKRWINEGKKNITPCPSNCDTTKFTYTGSIAPLMAKYCNGCHSGAGASGGVVLNSYAGIKVVADNGKLQGSINGVSGFSFMPKGGTKLSNCQLIQVKKWVQNGAPDN